MNLSLKNLLDWRLHLIALVIACISEYIGIAKLDIGIGTMILLPLLYAFLMAIFLIKILLGWQGECWAVRVMLWQVSGF